MRKKVPLVYMKVSENLYNKIEEVRKKFKENNGIEISLIKAGDLLSRSIHNSRIPNIFKNENKKKSRPI